MTIGWRGDLAGITAVGRLVGQALREMATAVEPGITTAELDRVGARFLRRRGARSNPQLTYDFPGFTCISVNEEIVHGVPGPRVLAPGDVVKLDVTAELSGYVADAAVTVALPRVAPRARRLRRSVAAAFARAIAVAQVGQSVAEIGRAIEREVTRRGFSVVRELRGHGVGRTIHEAPEVPNSYEPALSSAFCDGLVLAVEPMATREPAHVVQEADGWTLRTHNRWVAAQYEHTVVIRGATPLIVTRAA